MLKKSLLTGAIASVLSLLQIGSAFAQDAPTLESVSEAVTNAQVAGDTAFMLLCAALVLLMTPGLAFFYGGFVRSRNVLNTMMMSFLLMGIVSVTWILWGYSLAFAPGNPFIGGLQWLFLNGVGYETTNYLAGSPPQNVVSYAPTIPHQTYMIYQAMFAIITPALISGAIVERMNFRAYALFVLLWSTFIYSPMAHMVWGKGGLIGLYGGFGALDFAGGTVVHILSATSALVAAFVIGPRRTYPTQSAPPHNVPYILLGAGLLWFGWFGFNAGSAYAAGSLATVAFVATNTAGGAAVLTWLILEKVLRGKATAVGAATAAVVGLVTITPAAGFVTPIAAILIGSIGAVCCFFAISLRAKLRFDDSLDVFPVHGVGGTVGALLTGIFATTEVNEFGRDGLLFGNPGQLVAQIGGILIAYLLAIVGTFVILKILDATVGLRVEEEVEYQGLDINEHGEEAYNEEIGLGGASVGHGGLDMTGGP
ncbi:MAG: ammonium transporter [Leptolyngbyaceae cyanobacterium SM1_3_5]|nr:ammonium transporter [Leptolyngbyaceae cyanobacterium SM1_3_5]